jgi:ABC-2 type transport system ATP-binding protein
MADVEALCQRVIVIHHGRILFDGPLMELVQRFSPHKTLLRVPKLETPRIASRLLAELPVSDLTIEDPPIEEVIEQVFAQEATL